MHPDGRSRTRRVVAACAVLAAHLLLLLPLRQGDVNRAWAARDDVASPSVLVWLDDTAPAVLLPEPAGAARDTLPPNKATRRGRPSASATLPAEAAAQSGKAQDWYGAVADLAHTPGDAASPRPFGQMPSTTKRRCAAQPRPMEWSPEPQRAGLAGGLPYVRLGRCVVGLGFFGCRVGEAPKPNSHLLDGITDAPTDTSSVPDDADCVR